MIDDNEQITINVPWAKIHATAAAVDEARRGLSETWTLPGSDGIADAFGGSYFAPSYRGLEGLVRLVAAANWIARDVWRFVHLAKSVRNGKEAARAACRTAIELSRLFQELHALGLVPDPVNRICGTGEGYGLVGLHWLAGRQEDLGCSSAEIEHFVETGELPSAPSAAEAGERRRMLHANL